MAELRANKDDKLALREELARANELLSQVSTEIRVLEHRRADIRAGIEAETEQLKARRVAEIAEAVKVAAAGLPALKDERAALNTAIAKLSRTKQGLESDIVGLQAEISAYHERIGQLNREFDSARQEKETAEAGMTAISTQAASLQATINPLRDELGHVTEELRMVQGRREEVETEILAWQRNYQLTKGGLEKEIAVLERKRRDLAGDISTEAADIKRAREELTVRAETLAKQEKIVRGREYKVAMAEEKIASNVGLLNL